MDLEEAVNVKDTVLAKHPPNKTAKEMSGNAIDAAWDAREAKP